MRHDALAHAGRHRAKIAATDSSEQPVDAETARVEVANAHQVAIGATRQAP
jgi:hypothetical protein